MMRSLWTAATGMYAQQLNIDTISNNLANVNTTGFKKSRAEFQDLFYQTLQVAGASVTSGGEVQLPTGTQIGLGVKPAAVSKIFTTEGFTETENPLDLAIAGDGFFQITMPDGSTAYTRDGTFKVDSEGQMVTADGYFLDPEITIPDDTTNITITSEGVVTVQRAGTATPEELGQIELARFINPAGLIAQGKNLFTESAASGTAQTGNPGEEGFGTIQQGYLEMSNVKIVDEMVRMIVAQRAFELNSKAVQTTDDMLQVATNLSR